ncbi:MAG: hypothetical protein C4290_10590 [Chloroflexota bacterium]
MAYRAFRAEPVRGAAANLALAAGSLAFAVAATELTLQALHYPPTDSGFQNLLVRYDSLRGWRNIPGAVGEFTTEGHRVRLVYNSRGFRGPERPYAKPPGTYRIVLLGDSFLDGYSVPLEERLPELLERDLAARSQAIEAIALRTPGYSTDQELLWLEEEGLRYQPDLVVLLFYANDVWYNDRATYWPRAKPRFVLAGDTLVLTNVPVPRPEPADTMGRRPGFVGRMRERSRFVRLAVRAIKYHPTLFAWAIRHQLASVPPEMVLESGNYEPLPEEFMVFRNPLPAAAAAAWRVTDAIVARMQRDVQSHEAQLLVLYVPFIASVYPPGDRTRRQYGLQARGFDPEAVAHRFATMCERQHLHCIEPTARFRAAADSLSSRGMRLYYRHDWHWNGNGHRLAGRLIKEYLDANARER